MVKRGFELNEFKVPLLCELVEGWYTKRDDEMAIVILVGPGKIVVDPPGMVHDLNSQIVLVLPGADFRTEPPKVPFFVIPMETKQKKV